MNKKIIAVAIAAVIAAPAAMAETTLYGKAHMDITNTENGARGGNDDIWAINSRSSRLGIKGAEDLGNGMKAIFKYEMAYNGMNSRNGGAIGGARNSYVGLAGDFGTFLVGRHDTPAKVAFYGAGNERLGDSILDLNGSFGFDELRTDNAIAYVSPSFSGFTAAIAFVAGEQGAGGQAGGALNAGTGLADATSIGLMYGGHGVKASIGYTTGDDLATFVNDATLLNLGASYTMGAFSVGAQYQETEINATTKEALALTGTAGFGNNSLILMWGTAESNATGADVDSDTFGVALKHKMSKRTSAYVAYRSAGDNAIGSNWIGNGGTVRANDAYGIGMIHSF